MAYGSIMLGSHHLFNKGLLFEESARIPFLVHAPGRWASKVNSAQVASLIDIMPTVLAASGIEIPAHVQGRDLLATPNSGGAPRRRSGALPQFARWST